MYQPKTAIREIDGAWYAFGVDVKKKRVYTLGRDTDNGFTYSANLNVSGIRFVSQHSPNRRAAYNKARRGGTYIGELDDTNDI